MTETLDSIFAQADDSIEVVVIDGASTDGTGVLLEKYAAREPRLRFEILAAKGGVDKDFCRAVDLARGDYCWLFSDDDLLLPGAISSVLARLADNPSLVIVNAQVRDREVSAVLEAQRMKLSGDVRLEAGEIEKLFSVVHGYISFIGCVVVDRSLWQSRDKRPYLGTEFVHVGVIFQSALPGSAFVIAEPLIAIRYANAQWSKRSFEIWMFKWPRLIWSFESLSEHAKRAAGPREPWRSLRTLFGARASGGYSIDQFNRFISSQSIRLPYRLAAQAVAHLPQSICATTVEWHLRLKGSNRELFNEQRKTASP